MPMKYSCISVAKYQVQLRQHSFKGYQLLMYRIFLHQYRGQFMLLRNFGLNTELLNVNLKVNSVTKIATKYTGVKRK